MINQGCIDDKFVEQGTCDRCGKPLEDKYANVRVTYRSIIGTSGHICGDCYTKLIYFLHNKNTDDNFDRIKDETND